MYLIILHAAIDQDFWYVILAPVTTALNMLVCCGDIGKRVGMECYQQRDLALRKLRESIDGIVEGTFNLKVHSLDKYWAQCTRIFQQINCIWLSNSLNFLFEQKIRQSEYVYICE